MKSLIWCGAILFALATAAPAIAQVSIQIGTQQVPGFSNYYPWFNDVPQYRGNQTFRWFLANHPKVARELAQNPGLLYNASWVERHPDLARYLANHPYEWQALNGPYWAEGPAETQYGDYDDQHQWRDAYWWHEYNPNSFYDNHASWASLDSRWLDEDGAYDAQRQWHYGEWWYNQNPTWVTANHPNWLTEHQNWERPAEQQNYRQQHAMIQQNPRERNLERPEGTQHQDQRDRQENQQRAVDQRQNLQQQRKTRQEDQQQQMDRQQNQQQEEQAGRERRQANLQQQQTTRQENQQQQMNRQQNQQQQQTNREQLQATHQRGQRATQSQYDQQQAPAPQSRRQQQNSAPQREQANARQPNGNGGKNAQ